MNSCNKNQPEIWLGLDVGSKHFDAALWFGEGRCPYKKFTATPEGALACLDWCRNQLERNQHGAALIRIVMESTGIYSLNVRAAFMGAGLEIEPAIVNPHHIKAFIDSLGSRNKTDKSDARAISRFGAEGCPEPDVPLERAWAQLQGLVRERMYLIGCRTAERNRVETCKGQSEVLLKARKARIEHISKQIKELEKAIRETIASDEKLQNDIKILQSIPGVGLITAALVLGELGDLRRFANSRKLAAFAGVSPRQHTSGTSVFKATRMCRQGNRSVRSGLYLSALYQTSKAKDRYLGKFYAGLVARGKKPMSAMGAVMRKTIILMRKLLVENRPYEENYFARQLTPATGFAHADLWINHAEHLCTTQSQERENMS